MNAPSPEEAIAAAFSLAQQIACVRREIALRKRVYPRFVASGMLKSKDVADREIATMEAVHETLMVLARAAGIPIDG